MGCAAAVVMLVGLGLWQGLVYVGARAMVAHITQQMTAPAVALPWSIPDPTVFDYRHVTLSGHFLNARELYLSARSRYGNEGLDVLTPFVRSDGGGVMLVDRGWVPVERRSPGTRSRGLPWNTVTIEGIARRPLERGWFVPDNHPERNDWHFIDLSAMAIAAGLPATTTLAPVVVEVGPTYNPGGFPVGAQTTVPQAAAHFWYAMVGFGMAALVIVGYSVAHWHRESAGR